MHFVRSLLPLLLSTFTADCLTEETQLLCKQNAISVGRAVERDLLVNLLESRLREAGVQCRTHCQIALLQCDYFEFREVCRLTLVLNQIQEGFSTFRCGCFKLKKRPNISLSGKWYNGLMTFVTEGKALHSFYFKFLSLS